MLNASSCHRLLLATEGRDVSIPGTVIRRDSEWPTSLHPSSKGKRVTFSGSKRTVVDGPFAETKELIAGFWLWQVKSLEEAIEWVRRCPNPMPGEDSIIEIRPVFEADDFGKEFTPELRAQEERLRAEVERQRRR